MSITVTLEAGLLLATLGRVTDLENEDQRLGAVLEALDPAVRRRLWELLTDERAPRRSSLRARGQHQIDGVEALISVLTMDEVTRDRVLALLEAIRRQT